MTDTHSHDHGDLLDQVPSDARSLFEGPDGQAPTYRPILVVWESLLANVPIQKAQPITGPWCARICSMHLEMTLAKMPAFNDRYFDLLAEAAAFLADEMGSRPECRLPENAEQDVAENRAHYINVILGWQQIVLLHELNWSCTGEFAAEDLAVSREVTRVLLGDNGLLTLLDPTGFRLTEEESTYITQEMDEFQKNEERERGIYVEGVDV